MNNKAFELGMGNSFFVESTGLSSRNVSTARDLAKLVGAAHNYKLIRKYTTTAAYAVNFLVGNMPYSTRILIFLCAVGFGILIFQKLVF